MSLINDALKRAKQVQTDPPHTPAPGGAMEPVHYQRRGLPWYFFPVVAAVLGGACWFLVKGWDASRQAAAGYGVPITVHAREPIAPIEPAEKTFTPAVNNTPATPFAVNRNFTLEDNGANAGTPPEPATPTGPTFKLQGIFYRNTSPSALVNGKTVYIGERVSGARVKAIERDSVTLEYEGQTKTLTLE